MVPELQIVASVPCFAEPGVPHVVVVLLDHYSACRNLNRLVLKGEAEQHFRFILQGNFIRPPSLSKRRSDIRHPKRSERRQQFLNVITLRRGHHKRQLSHFV